MKQYQAFIFDSYNFDEEKGLIELHYSLDDEIRFTETIAFSQPIPNPNPAFRLAGPSPQALLALHLIGGISYYKTCLPKKIEVRSGELDADQARFWNTVYENGLGEFFYRNTIDFRGLIQFPSTNTTTQKIDPKVPRSQSPKVLVPIGGGKDSMVTVELLKKAGYDITLFRMGSHSVIETLAEQAACPLLTVKRQLAGELFDLNKEGALNGHIPITAYLSFLTIVVADLYGFDAVALSNERSANEGNTEYLGKEINHQWSKSLAFEAMFQEYVKDTITQDIDYFSALRPLSELHITKLFCENGRYLETATSCNANWKILGSGIGGGAWCCMCPKCAFVFSQYAAFLTKEKLMEIFGENLYDKKELLPLYKQLLGVEGFKPFECVGTPDEVQLAIALAHERGDLDDTTVMKFFIDDVLPETTNIEELKKKVFTHSNEQLIPEKFVSLLQN